MTDPAKPAPSPVPARAFPQPTAQVEVYFAVLGPELIVPFLLAFGGAELPLARNPQGHGRLEALVGTDRARALATHAAHLQRRVPLAKVWLARVLHWQGQSKAEIARQLRTSDVSVRKWLKGETG